MKVSAVILLVLVPVLLIAQAGSPKVLTEPQTAQPASATAHDHLGRETPRGTVLGFTRAAQAGDYNQAMQYLQLSASQRRRGGEEPARELKVVLDRAFVGSVLLLSDQPEGTHQHDLPPDRERAGRLVAGDVEADLLLSKVPQGDGAIWLISHETLDRIPDLYNETRTEQIEGKLPAPLVNRSFLGIPFWQWLALVTLAPICWFAGWLIAHVSAKLWRRRAGSQSGTASVAPSSFVIPSAILIACILNDLAIRKLQLPLLARLYYFRVLSIVFLVTLAWLASRIITRSAEKFRVRAIARGNVSAGTLVLLGQRIVKASVFFLLALALLKTLGFDLTPAVAGLGIGGIAIAFAAQKTLENLLGGITLLSDEVIRVGDFCKFGNASGVVEDISLRSTRIRTLERSELSIPNGSLSTMTIENLSRREKILINTHLGIRQDVTPQQLKGLLMAIRTMLVEHPQIEPETVRVSWTEISDSAFNIEVFCYATTRSFLECFEIREDCLMKILEIVHAVGTDLAYPSRTLYVESANREAQQLPLERKTVDAQESAERTAFRQRV
jgi:MscS family membrane protein